MAHPATIDSEFATAEDATRALGAPPDRARRLRAILKALDEERYPKLKKSIKKKLAKTHRDSFDTEKELNFRKKNKATKKTAIAKSAPQRKSARAKPSKSR
jgi:hypothetical protein